MDKCEEMCRLVSSLGPQKDVEAQDLMARLTLDIILRAGFGMRASYMSDLQPVPLLQELHYAMDESFRYLTIPTFAPVTPPNLTASRPGGSHLKPHLLCEETSRRLGTPQNSPGKCQSSR